MEVKKQKSGLFLALTIALALLAVAFIIVTVVILNQKNDAVDAFNDLTKKSESDISALEDTRDSLNDKITLLEGERDALVSSVDSLKNQLTELEISFENKDELYRQLSQEIDVLEELILSKEAAIEELKADLARLSVVYSLDINRQVEIINEIESLIKTGAPQHIYPMPESEAEETEFEESEYTPLDTENLITEDSSEDESEYTIITDEDGNCYISEYPDIAVYYYDITNGYEYSFNGDMIFDSASVVKLPTAMAIFRAADRYYKNLFEEEYLSEEETESSEEFTDEMPEYTGEDCLNITEEDDPFRFGEVFTYNKELEMSGTGVIKKFEDGTEYTFAELFSYMLRNSDNVAYAQIRNKYGFSYLHDYVRELKLSSMYESTINMSVRDAGRILLDAYEYAEEGTALSKLLIESMQDGDHKVMIEYAVSPKPTARKYGWADGAYHDAGIVFDENPYIVVIFSNLDNGGKEVDQYMRSIISLIDELHENFYNKKK